MENNPPNSLVDLIAVDVARAESVVPQSVVRNVTWTISENDFWVVGGFQGAGKSDLLATAACLQKPLSGTQILFGRDVRHMHEEELVRERLRIGMVYGTGRLFPQLTVAENVALPICYHRDCAAEAAGADVNHALAICGLSRLATSRSGDVSRNLHQRIGLARALALQPEALMIENPLFGVDQRQARWWLEFLAKLVKGHEMLGRKMTIVVATDDFRPWTEVGNQFGVIKNEQWHPIGSREELKQSSDPLVREMLTRAYDDL